MNKIEKLISFKGLLSESFDHFNKIRNIILKVFGITALGIFLIEVLSIETTQLYMENIWVKVLYIAAYLLFMVLVAILAIGFSASLKKKKTVSLKRVFNRGKDLLIPSIWVSAVLLIIQIGSFALFILPLAILSIYLVFAKISVVIDDKRGFDALVYSFDLVRGYWIKVLWKMVLIVLFFSFLVLIINGTLLGILGNGIIFTILFYIVNYLFIGPLSVITMYHLYEDVKKKPRITGKINASNLINNIAILGSLITIIFSITMLYWS